MSLALEDLLAPAAGEGPAGRDISDTSEWQAIREARRSDPAGNAGKWERERKDANWYAVRELASESLARRSKDLRLAVWLLEADARLHGFPGLRDSLLLMRRLIADFWDRGLYPEPEYRGAPLEWLGEDLAAAIRLVPITARADGQIDYSLNDCLTARAIGYERDLVAADGTPNDVRRRRRQAALAAGQPTAELFDAAIRATPAAAFETLASDIGGSLSELRALQSELEIRLDSDMPNMQDSLQVLTEIQDFIQAQIKTKRAEEPAALPPRPAIPTGDAAIPQQPLTAAAPLPHHTALTDGWAAAEEMVHGGRVQQGLSEMTRLAALEHGRARFLRKLALAEICQSIQRDRLAISILEELAGQIDAQRLDQWESPDLVGRVWGTLYRQYRAAAPGSDQAARATALFDKLCRLDPWQALQWEQ